MNKEFRLIVYIGKSYGGYDDERHSVSFCTIDRKRINIPGFVGKEFINFSSLLVFVSDLYDFYINLCDKNKISVFSIECKMNIKSLSKVFSYRDFCKFIEWISSFDDYSVIRSFK